MINTSEPFKLNLVTIIITLTGMLVMGLIITFSIGRDELTYMINATHTPLLNFVFKYITHAGDGVFAIALALYWMIAINKREGYYLFIIYGISSLITQFLKRVIFADAFRPIKVLDPEKIKLIEGITNNYNHSFPSGHATSIFAVAIAFALLINKPKASIMFISIAALVAYSRVYLLQHFATDIIAGAFIGSITAIFVFIVMRKTANRINTPEEII
jgi:membrane-associated phospholipid phosphatase